jgi:hypothetical protein
LQERLGDEDPSEVNLAVTIATPDSYRALFSFVGSWRFAMGVPERSAMLREPEPVGVQYARLKSKTLAAALHFIVSLGR